MTRMNKGFDDVSMSRKVSATGQKTASVEALKPGGLKTSAHITTGSKTNTVIVTHQQIEERAKAIWRQKGCPVGQDEKIWCEAEAQLKRELAAR
jgi:hypothetical protein